MANSFQRIGGRINREMAGKISCVWFFCTASQWTITWKCGCVIADLVDAEKEVWHLEVCRLQAGKAGFFKGKEAVAPGNRESGCSAPIMTVGEEESHSWLPTWTRAQLLEYQEEDAYVGLVKKWLEEGIPRPTQEEALKYSMEVRNLCVLWFQLSIRDGLLYREKENE